MRVLGVGLKRAIGALAAFAVGFSLCASDTAYAADPIVTQLPGVPTLSLGPPLDPASHVMQEFTIAGTATSYKEIGIDADGRWTVVSADTAPYVTRIVVIRPKDAAKFNGKVVVEWLNVSGGLDVGPVWTMTRRELLRSGSAYVALSAQRVGIDGGPSLSNAGAPLKKANPARYALLSHPGDAFSYDMLSQIGQVVKKGQSGVLGKLKAKHVIAVGESQSAGYLTTYVNAIDPMAKVFDGFLIHSRSGSSSALSPMPRAPPPAPGAAAPPPPRIIKMRPDLRVPVMIFLTETDVISATGRTGYALARRPDDDRLRAWEVAGTAHADAYMSKVGQIDTGTASSAELAAEFAATNDLRGATLAFPFNNAPQHHYVMESAIAHLENWVARGVLPPHGALMAVTGSGQADDPVNAMIDANGNIKGGIRSPWVDVPTSRLAGTGNSGSVSASLYGIAEPFDVATLKKLYPGGKAEYLRKFTVALDSVIRQGFILAADRKEILGLAAASWTGET